MKISGLIYGMLITFLFMSFLTGCGSSGDYYVNEAGSFYLDGNFTKGINILEKAVRNDSTNVRAFYNLGNFYLGQGNISGAINAYNKVLQLSKGDNNTESESIIGNYSKYYAAVDNLALAYLLTGNYSEAIKLTKISSKPGFDNNQPLTTSYRANILSGNYSTGMEQFNQSKKLTGDDEETKDDSILIYLFHNKKLSEKSFLSYLKATYTKTSPEKALEFLKPALAEQPQNPVFVKLQKKYNNPDYLKEWKETAVTRNNYLSAKAFIEERKYSDAEDITQQLLSKDPDNTSYLALESFIKLGKGDTAAAISIGKKIINLKPLNPDGWYNTGLEYLRADSLSEAEKYLTKSLVLDSTYPDANNMLGIIYSKSIKHLRKRIKGKSKKY